MLDLTLSKVLELIPQYVIDIAEALQAKGYEAYLVGGSIRDILLGKEPGDYDIATNAYPEEIEKLFPKSVAVGAKFGTIVVITEDETGERRDVEVTTYRSEADYVGGRWPTKVSFARTIQEDLERRDFTINAIALNIQEFDNPDISVQQILIDLFGGIDDLKNSIIRAVGNPIDRFSEDGLRAVRACRLAATLDAFRDESTQKEFVIDSKTFEAMKQTVHVTKQVSVERFRDELMKLLLKAPKPSKGLRLLKDAGVLELFIPELLEGIGINQPKFHIDDVFEHSIKSADYAQDSIKLAALFHDIAKPRTMSEDESGVHFYGHDNEGEKMTREIMKRLKFSNTEIERTARLVRWHMFYYPSSGYRQQNPDHKDEIERIVDKDNVEGKSKDKGKNMALGWSDAAVRRLIQNIGGEDAIDDLLKLRIADASANPKSDWNPRELDALAKRIAEVRAQDMILKITDLDISGNDLMENLDLKPGAVIGEVLNYLLEKVIEDPLYNKKVDLLRLAKSYLKKKNVVM